MMKKFLNNKPFQLINFHNADKNRLKYKNLFITKNSAINNEKYIYLLYFIMVKWKKSQYLCKHLVIIL